MLDNLNQETANNIWPNPWIFPVYCAFVGIISVVLGIMIIYTVLKHFRNELHIDMQLGLFMVTIDTISSFDIGLAGILNLPPLNLSARYWQVCYAQSISSSTTFVASMLIIGVVALERCLLIVYKVKLKDTNYWCMVLFCFIVTFSNVLLSSLTNSVHLLPSGTICHYSFHTIYGKIAHIIMLIATSASFTSLIVCYSKIVYDRNVTSKREQLELGLDPQKVKREVNRTTFKLVTILFINISTNSPYIIATLLGLVNPDYFSPAVGFFTLPWIAMDVWWNSVLFLVLNDKIYQKMKLEFWKSE